jgi:hypothetical protein
LPYSISGRPQRPSPCSAERGTTQVTTEPTLRSACAAAAFGLLICACSSSDNSNGQLPGDGGQDATTGLDGTIDANTGDDGTEAGEFDTPPGDAPGHDGSPSDGAAADSSGADGGRHDAMIADTGTADEGGQDSTVHDAGVMDTGAPDIGAETGIDASTTGTDGGTGAGGGPSCRAADGGMYQCNTGEHCCANASTQSTSCAIVCDADAGAYAVDCAGSTGTGQCGATLCCGSLTLNGGTVPSCSAASLTASCQAACNDAPPASCTGTFAIRLCTAASDCSTDTANPSCCNFGSSPVNWCVSTLIMSLGSPNFCL